MQSIPQVRTIPTQVVTFRAGKKIPTNIKKLLNEADKYRNSVLLPPDSFAFVPPKNLPTANDAQMAAQVKSVQKILSENPTYKSFFDILNKARLGDKKALELVDRIEKNVRIELNKIK